MFSNDNWRMRMPLAGARTMPSGPRARAGQMMLFDAYEAFGGLAGDPALFGLYPPCGGCDFMGECAEFLPYCPDEEAAEAMASAPWQPAR